MKVNRWKKYHFARLAKKTNKMYKQMVKKEVVNHTRIKGLERILVGVCFIALCPVFIHLPPDFNTVRAFCLYPLIRVKKNEMVFCLPEC